MKKSKVTITVTIERVNHCSNKEAKSAISKMFESSGHVLTDSRYVVFFSNPKVKVIKKQKAISKKIK